MTNILDGKIVSAEIYKEIGKSLQEFKDRNWKLPNLQVVICGENSASLLYVKMKQKKALELGVQSDITYLPENTKENYLLDYLDTLSQDDTVDAILLQMPLPKHISSEKAISNISPLKDVDGIHPYNLGSLFTGNLDGTVPCTPLGCMKLLEYYGIDVSGKRVDGLAAAAALVGVVGNYLGFTMLDPIAGLVLTVVILTVAWSVGKNVIIRMLDESDPKLVDELEEHVMEVDGVQSVSNIRPRWMGRHIYVELLIEVDGELSLKKAHAIGEEVRHYLFHHFPNILEIKVHIDPFGDLQAHDQVMHHTPN